MYNLGENFKFDMTKAFSNPECIFQGKKYRITVLTERLVRLEYSDTGIFEDRPTELVWYRNFPKPEFTVEEDRISLKITTKYFILNYIKEKPFQGSRVNPSNNLKISLVGSDRVWYYGHPEIRNYGASAYKLSNDKNRRVQRSLYSLDGFASIDDSKSSVIFENGTFEKRNSKNIDTYVFLYNNAFYYCLTDYFYLTGYPPLIPRYALGNWWSKNEFYSDFDISHLINKFETNNIPISVLMLNKWHDNNSFNINEKYKNINTIINYLHNKNIKVGITLDNPKKFTKEDVCYQTLSKYLTPDKNGNIPFDLFNPRVVDAFLKLIIHPLNYVGVDFFDISTFDKDDLKRTTLLKHFLYFDVFKNSNQRKLVSAYNSTVASHRYSVLYAGESTVDWDTLKSIPSFNASASNIGVSFWSHDFGGTSKGIEDNELYTRFIQLGVFSPILKLGSESGKYYKREPWAWGIKTQKITTDFLNLRYKLIPYIYTESYKYHKYGKPIVEPLYYKYPNLYDDINYNSEYFFGSNFLISPITTKKDYVMNRVIHRLFMPEGIWYDYFSGKKYTGNKKYISFYKDEDYPVFVRAGSIIPMSTNKYNDTSIPKKLEIQVFPGASSTYSIYEDDGETSNYLNGEYTITNIEFVYQKNSYGLTILPVSGKSGVLPETRDYKIRFRNTKPASQVISYVNSQVTLNEYYKDGTDLIVEIKDVPTTSQLTLLCKGDDIEIEAIRIINEDIVSIISDLPIKTVVKEKIDSIMLSREYDLKKKRIEIRKLANGKDYLERKYIDLFLKLLEYINEV